MKEQLYNKLITMKLVVRGDTRVIFEAVREQDDFIYCCASMLAIFCRSFDNGDQLSTIAGYMGHSILSYHGTVNENNLNIKLGCVVLDGMAQLGWFKPEKRIVMLSSGKTREQWMITNLSKAIRELIIAAPASTEPLSGYVEWEEPEMLLNNAIYPIVKRMETVGSEHYTWDKMPDVYETLNRMAQTEWKINTDMLAIIQSAPDGFITPRTVPQDELEAASNAISKNSRISMFVREIVFQELVGKGFEEKAADDIAGKRAVSYKMEHDKDYMTTISDYSKQRAFVNTKEAAFLYRNETLNFLYNCDSRGRVYVFNSTKLSPQGNDVNKALLSFKNPKPVSTYDLAVTIANHAGQDKLSYDKRVSWVQDNHNYILEVGSNPWSDLSMKWLVQTGIATEDKSRLQFVAACVEWVKMTDWIAQGNDQADFLCEIPVAYDATNSGLQVLSIIGRDEYVAPYVNITKTDTVGDVYLLIGKAVAKKKPIQELYDALSDESKTWRKIVKRNVMTKNYACTRYGCGQQQWEDKPMSDPKNDVEKEAWANLTMKQCFELGAVTYDTCSEYLSKAHQLMEATQTAVAYNEKALCTWKLPNGFTAFQYKPHVIDGEQLTVKIGGHKLRLSTLQFTNKANKAGHKSAIAPDVVHSIDAWLLTQVACGLPHDANLAFVHDAFGSDSCYGGEIQSSAKDAYYNISSRTVFSLLLRQISGGHDVPLPEPGTYDPIELFEADYLVC